MARPKANQAAPSAQERLETAFWSMLAETPFTEITVSALSARAGVNHNTFYYYFGSIEDMARKLFERNMMPELPQTLLPLLAAGMTDFSGIAEDERLARHFERARLFACSGSSLLTGILRDSIMQLWLDTVGLASDDLDRQSEDRLVFIFGGLVAALGDMGANATPERLAEIVASPLGRGLFETLAQIASRAK